MNILILIFVLATLSMQLSASDQKLENHMHALPLELKQKIISLADITALTSGTPSQYAALRDAEDTEQRQRFYVKHLLIALHFWDTDLMNDIVVFEIGRFRKKPELIFALDKERWEQGLICANYIKRTATEEQYQNFKNKFRLHITQIKGKEYRLFLPKKLWYNSTEFFVKPYSMNVSFKHKIRKENGAYIKRSLNDGDCARCARYTLDCGTVRNPYQEYNEYYAVSIWFDNISTTEPACGWYLQNNCINLTNIKNKNRIETFPTLPQLSLVTTVYDRLYLEALCGFGKDNRNYPSQTFWQNKSYSFICYPLLSPAYRMGELLKKTAFKQEIQKQLAHIIKCSIVTPTMGYQFLRSISPVFPTLFCTIPYYGIQWLFPDWRIRRMLCTGIIWAVSNLVRYAYAQHDWYCVNSDLVSKSLPIYE